MNMMGMVVFLHGVQITENPAINHSCFFLRYRRINPQNSFQNNLGTSRCTCISHTSYDYCYFCKTNQTEEKRECQQGILTNYNLFALPSLLILKWLFFVFME